MERLPRRIRAELATPELQEFVRLQGNLLRETLDNLGLEGIPIKMHPEVRNVSEFKNRRTLAYSGIHDIEVAIVASAGTKRIDPSVAPISTLLVTPTMNGSGLLVDETTNTLYADSFWVCEDGVFKYVKPTSPVPIDGIDFTDETNDDALTPFTEIPKRLYERTDDKQWTKDVLREAGVRVPRGIFLTQEELDIPGAIDAFLRDNPDIKELVFKENRGAHGDSIIMFDPERYDELKYIVNECVAMGSEIIIEERIQPSSPLVLEAAFDPGSTVDFNFRVLTTIRPQPQTIDAEIRFHVKDRYGVNISIDAEAARPEAINEPSLIAQVYATAEKATKAIHDKLLSDGENTIEFAGIDIVVDGEGEEVVLEVNTGKAGGFGTLCRLDKKPLNSVKDILVPSTLFYLEENFQKRTGVGPARLRRIDANASDLSGMIAMHYNAGRYEAVEELMFRLHDISSSYDNLDLVRDLVNIAEKTGKFDRALGFIDSLEEKMGTHSGFSIEVNMLRARIQEKQNELSLD